MTYMNAGHFSMAGALGIEPRSAVLETAILTAVLCPYELSYYSKEHSREEEWAPAREPIS